MRQSQVLFLHCFLRPFMSVLVLKGVDRKTGFYVQEISRANTCEGRWAGSREWGAAGRDIRLM